MAQLPVAVPSGWRSHLGFLLVLTLLLLPTGATPAETNPRAPAESTGSAEGLTEAPLVTPWAERITPATHRAEYPRPQMVRSRWLSLSGPWQAGTSRGAAEIPTGIDLPHEILVPFPIESVLSGLEIAAERFWYRRTFTVPPSWRGQRILLHFGAVDWEAVVLINGAEVGRHRGGFDPFTFDITDHLEEDGPQELLVHVYDPTDRSDIVRGKQSVLPTDQFHPAVSGIWQDVWLEPVASTRIASYRTRCDLPRRAIHVNVDVQSAPQEAGATTVRLRLLDQGKCIARGFGGTEAAILVRVPPEKCRWWTPEDPHLYDLEIDLLQAGEVVDQVRAYVALRSVEVAIDGDGVPRIHLNGAPYFQLGICDAGWWPDGLYAAPCDAAIKQDIQAIRDLGFNMIRKHGKTEPDRWYTWCDRLGILVWQDIPAGSNQTPQGRRQFEIEIERIIAALGNHPSIVTWVLFHEGWGQYDTRRLVESIKRSDPDRLVLAASGWHDRTVGDICNTHDFPGPVAPGADARRAAVLGAFGGIGYDLPRHRRAATTWSYRTANSSEELTERYCDTVEALFPLIRGRGLSAAIYSQWTDVFSQCDGLMTTDRRVLKVDATAVERSNRQVLATARSVHGSLVRRQSATRR